MAKKVLIVDDSVTIRKQVRAALTPMACEIFEAVDGAGGLRVIAGDLELALVLCDVNMPRMGGLEMLERVSETGRLDTLPIVMLTTEGQPALMQRAKSAGAKGWIVKPFKPELLVATVRKLAAM